MLACGVTVDPSVWGGFRFWGCGGGGVLRKGDAAAPGLGGEEERGADGQATPQSGQDGASVHTSFPHSRHWANAIWLLFLPPLDSSSTHPLSFHAANSGRRGICHLIVLGLSSPVVGGQRTHTTYWGLGLTRKR